MSRSIGGQRLYDAYFAAVSNPRGHDVFDLMHDLLYGIGDEPTYCGGCGLTHGGHRCE